MLKTPQFFAYKTPLIVVIILLASFLNSCATTKLSQCQKIIVLTQKMAKKIEEYRQSEDIQKALESTDVFEESATEMTNLRIEDPTLMTYQQGFAEVYQGYAETTRKFIEALQKKDITTARVMKQQVQQIGQQEQELGEEMNNYCQN